MPLEIVRVAAPATISGVPPATRGFGGPEEWEAGMWTDERVDQLKTLWTEGLSASQIARVLGEGITRNAVIGKVHRLGLAGRATPSRADRPRLPSAPRLYRAREPEPPVVEEEPITLEDGSYV